MTTAPTPCPDCGQSTRAGDVHTCSPAAPDAGDTDFDTPLAADEAFYLRDTDPRNDLISRDVGEAKEWMDEFAPEIVRRVRIVPVADATEAEARIRLDERRSFGPLVQRIAEDAARRTLEKIEEVADIVKREDAALPMEWSDPDSPLTTARCFYDNRVVQAEQARGGDDYPRALARPSARSAEPRQPTMDEMRARLHDANAMAEMERQFAELHARDCGFPSVADAEHEDIHSNFAKSCMLIVRGMGNAGVRDFVSQSLSTGGHE